MFNLYVNKDNLSLIVRIAIKRVITVISRSEMYRCKLKWGNQI